RARVRSPVSSAVSAAAPPGDGPAADRPVPGGGVVASGASTGRTGRGGAAEGDPAVGTVSVGAGTATAGTADAAWAVTTTGAACRERRTSLTPRASTPPRRRPAGRGLSVVGRRRHRA